MNFSPSLILLLFLSGIKGETFNEEVLNKDPHVLLKWRIDKAFKTIVFEVEAETKGWVGIGLSTSGSMAGADIFIGGVLDNGTHYSGDYYALRNAKPELDEHTDWELETAKEEGNKTFFRVSRLLNTCDQQDYLINDGTVRVIWGIGENDNLRKHLHKGSVSMDFFEITPNVDLIRMLKHRIEVQRKMPSDATTYWCSIHQGPIVSKKHHIVAFETFIPTVEAMKHTHHFILYRCHGNRTRSAEDVINSADIPYPDSPCYIPKYDAEMKKLRTCSEYIFTWAKGGKRMVFPPHVGYPFGDEGTTYFMLEVHYDNPQEQVNITFSTGVDIFYTDEIRPQEAGILTVGHDLFVYGGRQALIVPPRTTNFTVAGHCGSFCTGLHLPYEGINVFNVLLHSHLAGQRLKLRHFSNWKETELPFILKNDTYNFDYQQNRHLPKEIVIRPLDHLIYECNYSSGNAGKVVVGGLPTNEEMCMAFLWYYPRIEGFEKCTSKPDEPFERDFDNVDTIDAMDPTNPIF